MLNPNGIKRVITKSGKYDLRKTFQITNFITIDFRLARRRSLICTPCQAASDKRDLQPVQLYLYFSLNCCLVEKNHFSHPVFYAHSSLIYCIHILLTETCMVSTKRSTINRRKKKSVQENWTIVDTFYIYTRVTNNDYHFLSKLLQFPVKVGFTMTINKMQRQYLKVTGVDLRNGCFSHGHVACSRVSFPYSLVILQLEKITKNILLIHKKKKNPDYKYV